MRPLRFLACAQEGDKSTVEITAKTLQGRYLLRPESHVNSIIAGVLARAKQRFGVEIHAFVAMSSHMHLIISVDGVKQQARFMQYVMSNVARKVGKYIDWRSRFWQRRYRSIEINRDEESLLERFDYILRHGTKELLVKCPTEWPGLHCAWHYSQNQWNITGHWDDQTKAYRLRSAGKPVEACDYRATECFELDSLPCWKHLDRREIRRWVVDRLAQIRQDFKGKKFSGVKAILRRSVDDVALDPQRSTAPSVHCRDAQRGEEMKQAYRDFVRAFYAASARLEQFIKPGDDPYLFPSGCHPPLPPPVD